MANGNFGGGTGILGDPYLIEDAADLNEVRSNLTAHYKQMADINLSTWGNWQPIAPTWELPFTGILDFNNKQILNININVVGFAGLFGCVSQAELKNLLMLSGVVRSTDNQAGAIAAIIDRTPVTNCFCNVDVYGLTESSGFCADAWESTFERCANVGLVECTRETHDTVINIGGFVGYSYASIFRNCYSHTNIAISTSASAQRIGGFAGILDGDDIIENCYSVGSISLLVESWSIYDANGFCGLSDVTSSIINSYYNSDISGYSDTGNGEPLTTIGMKDINTFLPEWDFGPEPLLPKADFGGYPYLQWIFEPGIWSIEQQINDGYPYLTWSDLQPPEPEPEPEPEPDPTPWAPPENYTPKIITGETTRALTGKWCKVGNQWKLITSQQIYDSSLMPIIEPE